MAAHQEIADSNTDAGETHSLLRPMSKESMGSLCTAGVLAGLAVMWCVLDQWNHQVSSTLFDMGNIKELAISINQTKPGSQPSIHTFSPFPQFNFPLSLAFVQFGFMGVFFLGMYFAVAREWSHREIGLLSDQRWPILIVTHVFSTFWLQALMLPAQMFSLGIFAATRAAEVPAATTVRALPKIVGAPMGKRTLQTTGLTFVAACTLFYAYAQMSQCLCIWSGNGIALTGAAFWIIYLGLLCMPAVNTACQEGLMSQNGVHMMLMLSVQNLGAFVLFMPVMLLAHLMHWEDVGAAFGMMVSRFEVGMNVVWLCVQLTAISFVGAAVVQLVDSFWATALRSLRVVFWWLQQMITVYGATETVGGLSLPLSMTCPHTSLWSFVMICGIVLGSLAIWTDRKAEDAHPKFQAFSTKPAYSYSGP